MSAKKKPKTLNVAVAARNIVKARKGKVGAKRRPSCNTCKGSLAAI